MEATSCQISEEHTLQWASTLLGTYGPYPQVSFEEYWDPDRVSRRAPDVIASEDDTCSYFRVSILDPAVTAAIFLHAQHAGLTPEQAGGFPQCNWVIRNTSNIGSSGRPDLTMLDPSKKPSAVAEGKTARVCSCYGISVVKELPGWFQENADVIPIHAPGFSPHSPNYDTIYPYAIPWKRKLQYFFFQVCTENGF
jgi:hypothetical protein